MLDLFFDGAQITGLGMLAVFAIIAIIFFAIKGMGLIGKPKKAPKAKAEAPKAEPAPAAAPAPAPAANNDAELVAVIAAAVSAYCGEPVTKFRVVSFKRIK